MIYDVRDLCFKYPISKKHVLNDASLTLDEGEILSILGPNGSGKSTLLNCMVGLLKPEQGEIYLCGNKMEKMTYRQIAQHVSYVQQVHIPAFAYSVLNYVIMGRAPKIGLFKKPKKEDEEAAWQAMEILGITHLAEKPYTEISGGEGQQATIARAIVQEPKVIMFDEPTAHLDYGNQLRVLRVIKNMAERGYAVIMTTHNPDHAILLGGTAAILDREGRLDVGISEKIITEERLQEVYNTDLRLLHMPELSRIACVPPNL